MNIQDWKLKVLRQVGQVEDQMAQRDLDQTEWERNAVDCHLSKFQIFIQYENEPTELEAEGIETGGSSGRSGGSSGRSTGGSERSSVD